MKKKILFVMDSLKLGGAEKSLITILELFDYNKYEVDLFLFNHDGELYNMIPKNVKILNEDVSYKIFSQNRKISFIKYLFKLDFKRFFYSICWLLGVLFSKVKREKLYIGWKTQRNLLNKLEKQYDVSIAFLERKSIYFNIDKVKSNKKIGFIHNDYSKYPYDYKLDREYFSKYNNIATVSEHCKDVLIEIFPEYREKFIVIRNIVSADLIKRLANEKIDNYKIDENAINIVSVGRLVTQKGFDIAIEICKKIVDDGENIKWYIIGEGEERKNLETMIKKNGLENNFFLVGSDINPYKWINIANIYIQPSRYEGYGITVTEAKKLKKLIIASNIPEFVEQLKYDRGIIANDVNDYCNIIKNYIINSLIYNKYIVNLSEDNNNLQEFEKLRYLLDN